MNIKRKPCALMMFIFSVTLLVGGCRQYEGIYSGDYPELYTVAINSIIGTRGHAPLVNLPSSIDVLDVDNFGRAIFSYYDMSLMSRYSIVISQYSEDGYVYYYSPPDNYICLDNDEITEWGILLRDAGKDHENRSGLIFEALDEDKLAEFMHRNDWNQPLDLAKAESAVIVNKKEDQRGPVSRAALRKAYKLAWDGSTVDPNMVFFRTDAYGRSIYAKEFGTRRVTYDKWEYGADVFLFRPDLSLDPELGYIELDDAQDYHDELREFLARNDWNEPWEDSSADWQSVAGVTSAIIAVAITLVALKRAISKRKERGFGEE